MSSPARFLSLGAKLAVGMVAIVAATSTLVFREVVARERHHLVGAKVLAASMVADLFATGLAAPLDFADTDAAAAEVANVKKNAEVSYAAAWLLGARFDIVWHQLRQGFFRPPAAGSSTEEVIRKYDHGEL